MLPLPEILLTLSPAALRALLTAFAPFTDLPSPKSPPATLARALFTASTSGRLAAKPAPLLAATLPRFATRAGRLALVEAARAVGDPRAAAWLTLPAADVGATLAIEAATAKGRPRRVAKRIFALADQRLDRDLPERPTYELLADAIPGSPDLSSPSEIATTLRARFGADLLDLWDAPEPDGALRFALFLRQPAETRLVFDPAAPGSVATRTDVPVAVDIVRILPAGASAPARIAITTAMPERLPEYARALDLSLRPSLTLRPLETLTAAALYAIKVPGVARIELVAERTRGRDTLRVELRGRDLLSTGARDALLGPGYTDRATLRITLDDGRKVDAFLQLPYRLDVSHRHLEAPVRAALDALGVFRPGALPDDARSLAPYEHGEWRWVSVLGAHFARLNALGRFVRIDAPHVVTEEHRMHGAGYVVREVPGEEGILYALAEDRSLGARLVTAKDRIAWRLDLGALAAAMRADLDATAAVSPLVMDGILDLGVVTLASGRLRIFYVMGEPPEGWVEAVRRACGVGVTPVLIVPAGHAGSAAGMLEVEIDVEAQFGAKRIGRVLGRIAQALGAPDEVKAWRQCDEDVVVELATKSVWVHGILMNLGERAYKLLAELALAGGLIVATKELGARISNAGTPDVTTRKARIELENVVIPPPS